MRECCNIGNANDCDFKYLQMQRLKATADAFANEKELWMRRIRQLS
uniref:Uncharacterized protein n=1 Tax=Parascaris equorum TaxID=6256 RepID=A0A914S2S8_PAREQ